jgi:predicted unusual protein kinase regulating ubiquinone biosynthesis (AarF/ABC1/UbiB family)
MEYRKQHRRMSHMFRRQPAPADSPFSVEGNISIAELATRARQILQELGPGYSCLALYLSSRIDLLPAEICREFALTPDSSPPPTFEVQRTLEEEFHSSIKGFLAEFNPLPVQSTLLTHSYAAKLANGVPVVINVLRPECSALHDLSGLPASFNKAIVQEHCGSCVNDDVFLDFFVSLRRKCDFGSQMEALEWMAHGDTGCDVLCGRRIYRELCTSRIMIAAPVEGLPVDEAVRRQACNTDALARTLCHAWLYQALRGCALPVDPQNYNIILADNRVLFTGCDFITLPSGSKENLWNYLMATMADDPDKAAMCLLQEMWPAQRAKVDAETFRSKFRQSAYFGLLEPLLGRNTNALPQLIFQHWKTALEYGYAPKPHLLCFYRGLFSIARIAQKLSPFGDPLREGVEEARSDRIMEQMKDIVDWQYWFQNSEKFATALVTLPRIVDDALTRTSTPKSGAANNDRPQPQATASGSTAIIMAIFVLCAVLFVSQLSNTHPAMQTFALVLVLLAGLMALRDVA